MTSNSAATGPSADARAHQAAPVEEGQSSFSGHRQGAAADLFLAPHADDVCFSLADLVSRRRAGRLLTIFSESDYLARSRSAPDAVDVTRIRLAEDAAFAAACGLVLDPLGLPDARRRGEAIFSQGGLGAAVQGLEAALLGRILAAVGDQNGGDQDGGDRASGERAWLFAPAGIGGHVDHVAVMTIVARNLERLLARYQVCFYEDLPYASDVLKRSIGLRRLANAAPRHTLIRHQWPVGASEPGKVGLLRLYASQFAAEPSSLQGFSPAPYIAQTPHEAVWVARPRASAAAP
jgi:hypothetical protein